MTFALIFDIGILTAVFYNSVITVSNRYDRIGSILIYPAVFGVISVTEYKLVYSIAYLDLSQAIRFTKHILCVR